MNNVPPENPAIMLNRDELKEHLTSSEHAGKTHYIVVRNDYNNDTERDIIQDALRYIGSEDFPDSGTLYTSFLGEYLLFSIESSLLGGYHVRYASCSSTAERVSRNIPGRSTLFVPTFARRYQNREDDNE